jgi:hypothetical protein
MSTTGSHYMTLAQILWKTLFPTMYLIAMCIFIITEACLNSRCLAKGHVMMSQHSKSNHLQETISQPY